MSDLLVIVPSRGRPSAVAELLDSWRQTTGGAAELLVVVDDDDPALPAYRALDVQVRVHASTGTRGIVPVLNAAAIEAAESYPMVGFFGDDHRPRTQAWDVTLAEALAELKTGLVYGDDLLRGEALPTAVAMTSNIVTTLGWMAPPTFTHLWVDNVWHDLGHTLGRLRYLPGVVIEHMHPAAGKGQWDELYKTVNDDSMYARDKAAYKAYHESGQFDRDVAALRTLP
ncbi:hypothetical protein Sme01_03140 [Sphaerisporangium melleum]|uniref:Glycosyltransferase n=1 Tax=Sphaerisporangium melleum TaxID=321316 RepID=A0A917QNU9_9ACTN|nr:glycosyltransferase [Sphaerisporangium melleum]GGK61462.1 hypothetical protein GCM10007964_00680 [Sphaerisporangium melleum]GII67838.1 hypothetical protein Sme01_03140 [Sphaerisporangium melleum]